MSIREYTQSIIERLHGSADVKTIYGEAVVAEGKTIIPVARAAYWFGACSGRGRNEGEKPKEGREGGAGGVYARPVGIVEVTKDETRFIPIEDTRRLGAILLLGFFLGIMVCSGRSKK